MFLAEFLLNFCFFFNDFQMSQDHKHTTTRSGTTADRLVIFAGAAGTGKSFLGNLLVKKQVFKSAASFKACTIAPQLASGPDGLLVIDTPGLESHLQDESLIETIMGFTPKTLARCWCLVFLHNQDQGFDHKLADQDNLIHDVKHLVKHFGIPNGSLIAALNCVPISCDQAALNAIGKSFQQWMKSHDLHPKSVVLVPHLNDLNNLTQVTAVHHQLTDVINNAQFFVQTTDVHAASYKTLKQVQEEKVLQDQKLAALEEEKKRQEAAAIKAAQDEAAAKEAALNAWTFVCCEPGCTHTMPCKVKDFARFNGHYNCKQGNLYDAENNIPTEQRRNYSRIHSDKH
jgi:hypothetical protein